METFWRTINRSAPASSHAADQRLLDGRQKTEQDERHDNGQQRQRRAEFFALQIAPDEVEKFHFTGSLLSWPLFK